MQELVSQPEIRSSSEILTAPYIQEEGSSFIETLLKEGRLVRDFENPEQMENGRNMLRDLITEVLEGELTLDQNLENQILQLIADIDQVISNQVNEIIHQAKFQVLEGTWRGLERLVFETETGPLLKINVLDAKKEELYRNFEAAPDVETASYFHRIYRDEFDTYGGTPYGCVIGDYYFDVTKNRDYKLLGWISQAAASGLCPFITGVSPTTFGWKSFTEHTDKRDVRPIFGQAELLKYQKLRETEDSKFLGLVFPRYLSRDPYNENTYESEYFNFREDVDGMDDSKFCYSNSAYLVAGNITRAWAMTHWPAAIRGVEGGGIIEDLPVHLFKTDEGDTAIKCPTEVLISDRREKEFAGLGFIPVVYKKDSDVACVFSMQSIYKPKKYDRTIANASEYLSSQLQYLMCALRMGHYLKVTLREKTGSSYERNELEEFINRYLSGFVLTGSGHTQEEKAQQPFKELKASLEEDPNRPGCYKAVVYARPHYQLDEINVSLRLVPEIPKRK